MFRFLPLLLLPMTLLAATPKLSRDFQPSKAVGSAGVAFSMKDIIGQNGTILVKFSQNKPIQAPHANRAIFTLRCHSRLQCGLAYIPNNSRKFLFHFGDRDGQLYYELPEEFAFGRAYIAAISWDGAMVRLYLDGRLLAEYPQPVPLEKPDALHLGPYHDDWIAVTPWADDTLVEQITCFDEALPPPEIAALSGATPVPSWQEFPAHLTVPVMTAEDLDWKQAASLPELTSLNSRVQGFDAPDGRFLLAATPNGLQFSFEYFIPAGNTVTAGQPRTPTSEPEVWGSESFEFYVKCNDHTYRFTGNVAGGYAESRDNVAEWNGPWRYDSRLEMQIDNSQRWRGSGVIPWSTLDAPAIPDGPFSCCLARTWCLPDYSAATVLYGNPAEDSYNQPSRFCTVRFAKDTPVLQQLTRNNPERGDLRQKVRLDSPATTKAEYQLSLLREDGTAQPLDLFQRRIDLAAGQSTELDVAARISSGTYDLLRYRLIAADGELLMQCLAPFRLNQVAIALKPHYLSGTIEAEFQRPLLQRLAGNAALQVTLLDATGTELFCSPLDADAITLPFRPESPAGTYTVQVQTADGKAIDSASLEYPGLGEWATAQFDTETVLPPFTPLETDAESHRFSVWGRNYEYQNGLLPTRLATLGLECFLAEPQLVANGKALVAKSFDYTLASHTAARAEFSGNTTYWNDAELRGGGFVEYDGVTYHRLTLSSPTPLKDITLRFTLAPEMARYVHASGSSSWGSKITRAIPQGHSTYQFFPMFWLGMEDKGLCFFTETRKGWSGPANAVFTIDRTDTQAILEIHLRDRLEANEEFAFEIGLCATPVRPPHPNAPLVIRGDEYTPALNRPGHLPVTYASEYRVPYPNDIDCPFADLPAPDRSPAKEHYIELLRQRDECGNYGVVYLDSRCLSDQYPEVAAFREDWQNTPGVSLDYTSEGRKYQVFTCCPTTGASAFFLLKLKTLLTQYDFDGVYFDFALMDVCNNRRHGCDEHWPILATREFYRRVALLLHQLGKPEPIIILHNTDAVQLPAMNFATMLFNGEQIRQASSPMLHDGKDLLDNYGVEMFATELSSLPFGLINAVYLPADVLLPENGGGKEEPEKYVFRMTQAGLAGTLPHNTILAQDRVHYGLLDKVFRIYEAFGVTQAAFHGYWERLATVSGGKDIYVSCYVSQDHTRALAVISHIGKSHDDQEVEVTFDWQRLDPAVPLLHATDCLNAPDDAYQELYRRRAENHIHERRAPLDLGNFGSEILSWDGTTLRLRLNHHCFALVELSL